MFHSTFRIIYLGSEKRAYDELTDKSELLKIASLFPKAMSAPIRTQRCRYHKKSRGDWAIIMLFAYDYNISRAYFQENYTKAVETMTFILECDTLSHIDQDDLSALQPPEPFIFVSLLVMLSDEEEEFRLNFRSCLSVITETQVLRHFGHNIVGNFVPSIQLHALLFTVCFTTGSPRSSFACLDEEHPGLLKDTLDEHKRLIHVDPHAFSPTVLSEKQTALLQISKEEREKMMKIEQEKNEVMRKRLQELLAMKEDLRTTSEDLQRKEKEVKMNIEKEKKKVSDLEGSIATLTEDLEETRARVETLKRQLVEKALRKDTLDIQRERAEIDLQGNARPSNSHPVGVRGVKSLRPISYPPHDPRHFPL